MADFLTVGDLKRLLADVADDTPVVVPGGEWDYTDATDLDIKTMDYMGEASSTDDDAEPVKRTCVVIE